MERRLSAILAADVVGYSRLMAENEADTFDRLRAHRRGLFEPEIAQHNGRIFKLMGDGLLAEFGSVVDATGDLKRSPPSRCSTASSYCHPCARSILKTPSLCRHTAR